MKSIVPISVLSRLPSIGITIRQNSIEVADIIAHKEKHVKVCSEDDGQGSAPEKEHAEGTHPDKFEAFRVIPTASCQVHPPSGDKGLV